MKDRKSCDDGNHIYNNFQNISIFAIRCYAIKNSVSDSSEGKRKSVELCEAVFPWTVMKEKELKTGLSNRRALHSEN